MYDVNNPNDVQKKNNVRHIIAWVLIFVSIFILFAVIIRYYIVRTYKIAAVATGVGEGLGMGYGSSGFESSSEPIINSNASLQPPSNN